MMRLASIGRRQRMKTTIAAMAALVLALAIPAARAQIDGHGPDAWRVTDVAASDMLNARMGPGTNYPVIETFAPNERGLQQITCVPYYAVRHRIEMTEEQIEALPPSWCLMRGADMTRAGWVAQRFIRPDDREAVASEAQSESGDPLIDSAASLVRDLYNAFERSTTRANNPFMRPEADKYFFADVIADMRGHGADVLYGAQDFQGEVTHIAPDPDQPMFRGTITVNVDFTNWGEAHRAIFWLRSDTARPDAPFRILQVESGDRTYPE